MLININMGIITKTKFGEGLNKNIYKIISLLIFSAFTGILIIAFYEANHLFVIIVPFIIWFYLIMGYSVNVELSDEDIAGIVIMRPYGTAKMKRVFLEIFTFPAYYLIKSWKTNLK